MDAERGVRGSNARSRSLVGANSDRDVIPTVLKTTAKRSSTSSALFRTVTWILIVLSSSFLAFYIGVWTGIHAASSSPDGGERKLNAPPPPPINCPKCNACANDLSDADLQKNVEALAKQKVKAQLHELCAQLPSAQTPQNAPPQISKQQPIKGQLFSKSIQHFAQGLVRVSKDDLMETFDFGVPPNADTQGLDALILYNKLQALPSDELVAKAARYEDPTKPLPLIKAKTATENCDTMNVLFIDNPGNTKQCFALIGGQYQSYHIQRWMRRPDGQGKMDPKMPLKLTSHGWTHSGRQEFPPPRDGVAQTHQKKLLTYLQEVDDIKARLQPILKSMNSKTIVVLTCNHGQSELLMNFACSARARGFDLKNILVFPTDIETKELAEGVGLTTFYEEKLMASIPKQEAAVYGDHVFTSVMFAKVLCVQLVNELGYDLLFQDVDVVWFKDPLTYFHDKTLPEFDMYFQDDGSRQERYAPYSANTGFYYVRSNGRTKNLFRHMLYTSDLIGAWNSHQQVLVQLLAEHNSVMGLTVKIFAKQFEEFPGGLHYHRKVEQMKKILKGESNAYIFHMSWTNNKDNKLKFFQQMGEWYVQDACVGKEPRELSGGVNVTSGMLVGNCCSAEPLISCHYRDKPSKIPCPDAPFIDKKGKSFW